MNKIDSSIVFKPIPALELEVHRLFPKPARRAKKIGNPYKHQDQLTVCTWVCSILFILGYLQMALCLILPLCLGTSLPLTYLYLALLLSGLACQVRAHWIKINALDKED